MAYGDNPLFMETEFQGVPENTMQILLIKKMAKKMGIAPDLVAPHWIDLYSPVFRELWEAWERDQETIETRIYTPDPLGGQYADMVSAILIGKPDERLTQ